MTNKKENMRSWILVHQKSGKTIKYVRNRVFHVTEGDTHYKGVDNTEYWWTTPDIPGGYSYQELGLSITSGDSESGLTDGDSYWFVVSGDTYSIVLNYGDSFCYQNVGIIISDPGDYNNLTNGDSYSFIVAEGGDSYQIVLDLGDSAYYQLAGLSFYDGDSESAISDGDSYFFLINGDTQTIVIDSGDSTNYTHLIDLISTAVASDGYLATITGDTGSMDIKFSGDTNVTLSEPTTEGRSLFGDSNGFLVDGWTAFGATGTQMTYTYLVGLMDTAITGDGFTAYIINFDIRIGSDTNPVSLDYPTDGDTLWVALDGFTDFVDPVSRGTYDHIISLINNELSSAGISASIVGSDIRFYAEDTQVELGHHDGDTLWASLTGWTAFDSQVTTIYGDTWGRQGDTVGKIVFDYNKIVTNLSGGDSFLKFPENGGDTYLLSRRNTDMPGDTLGLKSMNYIKVRTDSVEDVQIINSKKPEDLVIG